MGQEVRWALRRLFARPGLSLAAVLTLALGIGATTAVYSLLRGVLLTPLPYERPEQLSVIWDPAAPTGESTWLSAREWVEYRQALGTFADVAAYSLTAASLVDDAEPERVVAATVTGNTFAVLGVSAALGRALTEADDGAGRTDVVLLGHELWQRRFGGVRDVIGRSIRVNGEPRTVIGIMPPGFRLPLDYREPRATELWMPAGIDPADAGDFGDRSYFIFGRLRSGAALATAHAEVQRVNQQWLDLGYVNDRRTSRTAVALDALVTGGTRPALLVLMGAVACILLIACANVTNLLLARSDARRREVATQAALGASRVRIARQLLIESGLLAAAGCVLGVGLAVVGLQATRALTSVAVIRNSDIGIDGVVLVFSALAAVAAMLLAGSAPALDSARVDLSNAMGTRGIAQTVRRQLRQALVVAQTALSVVLVIGAVLLLRTFHELRRVDLGFDAERVLSFRLALPTTDYPENDHVVQFYDGLISRLAAQPGVTHAGAVRVLPLSGTIGDWSITIEGQPRDEATNPNGDWQIVTPGYFDALGIELVRGNFFTNADRADGVLVAVIDENMAARYWPDTDPIGKRFHLGTNDQPWVTIVGVTRPIRHNAILEEARAEMYLPHAQWHVIANGRARSAMTVVMKTTGEPTGLVAAARSQVHALDAQLPVAEVQTLDAVVSNALAQPRFIALMLAVFATIALTLAAIGTYGVIAYLVTRRTAELGIRQALGATAGDVIRLVLREGLTLAGVGVLTGVVAAAVLSRLVASLLYRVQALDPFTFLVVPGTMLAVGLIAAGIPALRAARTAPVTALRSGG